MKLSALNSNKSPSSYDQPSDDLIKWPHLKSPEHIKMHQNSPNIYIPLPLKATPFFRFKSRGMPSFLPTENIYQQTRSVHNKKNLIITSTHILFSPPLNTSQRC